MSESDSESTYSDNNNMSLLFNNYVGPRPNDNIQIVDTDSSSGSSMEPEFDSIGSSSNDSEVILNNPSEEEVSPSHSSCHSSRSSPLFLPFTKEIDGDTIKHNVSYSNNWCITKELYKREIGNYKNPVAWSNKFYQSVVAVQKLKLSKQLKGHNGCVNSLGFNSSGNLITSGSDDCRICLWDWSIGKRLLKFKTAHIRNIFQTKFLTTQGDIQIVSSGQDGLVILSTVKSGALNFTKTIARHARSCNKISVHPNQQYIILSCGEDGVVKNIDIRESPINENQRVTNILNVRTKNGFTVLLYGIDINPMNPFEFIVHGNDEYVRLYDKRKIYSSQPVKLFRRHLPASKVYDGYYSDSSISDTEILESQITSAVYNYDGSEILASYSEDDIYLFDINGSSNTYLHHYGGHLNRMTIKGVNFYGPKSDYVVSGSDCGYMFVWDKQTEAIVQRKHADSKGAVNVLEPHPYIPTLATSGVENTIKIWEPLNRWHQPNKNKLRMCLVGNKKAMSMPRSTTVAHQRFMMFR